MSDSLYVRLKPQDKKRGILVKRYTLRGTTFLCDSESGRPVWYQVTKAVGEYLKTLKQVDNDPDSKLLMDVVTPAEHAAIAKREQELILVKLGAMSGVEPVPTTVAVGAVDRTPGADVGRKSAIPDMSGVSRAGTGVREAGDMVADHNAAAGIPATIDASAEPAPAAGGAAAESDEGAPEAADEATVEGDNPDPAPPNDDTVQTTVPRGRASREAEAAGDDS